MARLTRRDLVKAGLAASAGVVAGSDLLAEAAGPGHAAAAPVFAQPAGATANPVRERLLLDYGWRFALGNANDPDKDFGFGKLRREGTFAKAGRVDGPAAPRFDDSAWRRIDLPHDWALDLPFVNDPILVEHGAKPLGREYPETSIGWYRREFFLPASDTGRRIYVEFDGIFRNAMVFFNGHFIARNMSGYAPLTVDLSDLANFGDKTVPRPGAEPAGRNVLAVRVDASLDEGWFYEGAGIYRHVWLTKTAPVHVVQWGTY
ncbi:MAG TPA: beta-galactosidase, partial [Terracidiphilus sp.]|nr:beta-galactosidase [Terracidiphilus sp.]